MSENSSEKVVTRFAPSPTGLLQLGNYRTALFSYLFARQNKGTFLLRIEDTDKARSKPEYDANIIESLAWLGLEYDNKDAVPRQSERSEIYKKYIQKLIESGHAYVSQEKVEKEGDRAEVIRFKNPNKKVAFTDLIRGTIEFDTTELKDFVIAKSFEEPTFHLAVVVDDFEMGITHIVRGEDHISNTPRQILIQEAIGASTPAYAHLPLVLAPDKTKLSKRKGAKALTQYRDEGFLAPAIINFLALLGWNPGGEKELFTLKELIEIFDLSKVNKSGAIFNEEKLKWFNKEYIKKLSAFELEEKVKAALETAGKPALSQEMLTKFTPVALERISTFSELELMIKNGEFEYVFAQPIFDPKNLLWKGKGDFNLVKTRLATIISLVEKVDSQDFTKEKVKETVWAYAEQEGRGEVLWPMRFALSGKEKSPDPFVLAELLGKEETCNRLHKALELVSHNA